MTDTGRFAETDAETAGLRALSDELGVRLAPRRLETADGARTEIEGVDRLDTVIAQFVLNRGVLKSAIRNKVTADMFKLVWLRATLFPRARAVLAVSPEVATLFARGGWIAAAARDLDVDVRVVDVDPRP